LQRSKVFLERLLEKDCCDPERALEKPQMAGIRM
jgi:hypothetical protein